jgi:hypothetical protein
MSFLLFFTVHILCHLPRNFSQISSKSSDLHGFLWIIVRLLGYSATISVFVITFENNFVLCVLFRAPIGPMIDWF